MFANRNLCAISYPWLWSNILVKIIDYHFSISDRRLFVKLMGVFTALFGFPSFIAKLSCLKSAPENDGFWSIMLSVDSVDFYTLIAFIVLCFLFLLIVYKKDTIEHVALKEANVTERLAQQVKFQTQKNEASGKYLPGTFIEASKVKEQLRCFADPVVFYKKNLSSISRLNFDYYTRRLLRKGLPGFRFNLSEIPEATKNYEAALKNGRTAKSYLDSLLSAIPSKDNTSYFLKRKFEEAESNLPYIYSQFCIILGNAGQGKTNFLCDLAANVLLKRNIPSLFLNAFEIKADAIEQSISHAIYPSEYIPLATIFKSLDRYCERINKPFVIIVDGLNENPQPSLMAESLKSFIKEIQNYPYIKVVLSCRSEYYEIYFQDIETVFLEDNYVIKKDIYSHLDEHKRDVLVKRYLAYFKIAANLDEEVEKELSSDLLLLRIFSEAFSNKQLGSVNSLLYDEMYHAYYDKMTSRAVDKLKNEKGIIVTKSTIQSFFIKILTCMIDQDKFMGVEMSTIEQVIPEREHELFHRFIDENILLRRDIDSCNTSLGSKELVSFTYDNFRDYLIADYIVNCIYFQDLSKFKSCVDNYTTVGHTLKEGIVAFLFLLAKKQNDISRYHYLRTKSWFDDAFLEYIWQIPNEFLNQNDVEDIKRLMVSRPRNTAYRLVYWGRWDTNRNPLINITLLLNHLSSLNDIELKQYLNECWKQDHPTKYPWGKLQKSETEQLVEQLNKIVDEKSWEQNKEIHNVMEFALYFASISSRIYGVYKRYQSASHNIAQMETVESISQSSAVIKCIKGLKS